MDCVVAEDDGLDSGGGSMEGGEENANVSSQFGVGEEGEEFLSSQGEGFSHFSLVEDFLDSFCFLIGGQEFLGMSEVSLWFP